MSTPQRSSPQAIFFKAALVVVAALGVMWLLLSSHSAPPAGRDAGTAMPPIKAIGWLNGPEPTAEELKDRVLVIDAWASWCGPCRRKAPEMVQLYEKYHDQGVQFIGLSNEAADRLPEMEEFLKDTGIPWPNAYGADETFSALGVEYIPMVWVVDRQQRIVWNMASSMTLEEGIRQALASK